LIVEGLQVVLHVHSDIVNSGKVVLPLYSGEAGDLFKVVASGLLVEDLLVLFLGLIYFIERCTLVHSSLSNTAPPSEDYIKLTVGIVE
jgi:hypothetical protein